MDNITLDPYLFFGGNCKEAMEFYKSIFGGELEIQLMDDVPGDFPEKESMKGQVMHAKLDGGDVRLYASDGTKASPKSAKVELCLGGTNEEKLTAIYNKLSEGGDARMPLKKEFWGDTFGALTDKFGVDWMVNISTPAAKE
jgi:PhnB protein